MAEDDEIKRRRLKKALRLAKLGVKKRRKKIRSRTEASKKVWRSIVGRQKKITSVRRRKDERTLTKIEEDDDVR